MRAWTWLVPTAPAILLVAALVPGTRPGVALLLPAGWLALRLVRPAKSVSVAWAATIPVAISLAWPWVLGSDAPLGAIRCTEPLSVIAVRRLLLVLAVLLAVLALGVAERSSASELGLRVPTMGEGLVAGIGLAVVAAGGLVIGPLVARPFFGELSFPVPPAALAPAALFGFANGVAEEVAYRGALQAWLARTMPAWQAVVVQAVVFGIVHAGPEVVALLPLHIALLAAIAAAAGAVRLRTGSLALPIGIHIGADVALYVGLACRAAA